MVHRFGAELRAAVRAATGLPASVGAGSGKQLAKIASELAKPDGLRVVARDRGAGRARSAAGARAVGGRAGGRGRRCAGSACSPSVSWPRWTCARPPTCWAARWAPSCTGWPAAIDDRPVAPRAAAKQVSAETTFDADLTAMADVHDAVARMTAAAHRRLRRRPAGPRAP